MNVLHDNHHHHHSSVYSDLNFSTKKFDMSTNVMDTDIHDISTNVNTDNITDNSNSNPFYKLLTHFPSYVFMNNHHHGADSMNTIHEPILTSGNFIGNGTSAFRTPSPIMDFLKEQSNITQSSPKQPLSNHMYPKNLCHQNTILTDDMTGQFSSTKMHITDLQSTIQLANKLAQHFISLSNNHNCSDPVKCDPAVLRTEQPTYQRDYHILQQPQPQQEQEQMTLLNSTYLNLASKMNNFCETNIHSLEQLTELLYQQYYHPNINTTGNSNSSSSNKPSFLLDSHNQMDSSHFDETVQFTPLQSSLEESGCIDLSYSGANKTPTGQNKLSLVNPSSATLLNDIVACSTISSSNNTESNTDHHIGESSETCESLIQKTLNKLHQNSNISSFLTSTLKTASMMNASSIPSSSSYNISNEPTSKVQQTTVNYSPLQTFPLSFTLPVNTNDYHGTNDFFSNLLKLKIPTPDKLKEIFVNTMIPTTKISILPAILPTMFMYVV
ncbi:unnamed protein product [Heterobilharzia americana]|nr:unnamed protein product [Heterobilharzia americana]